MFKLNICLVGLVVLIMCSLNLTASTYYIAEGGISDHGDVNTANSIAWYFDQYGNGNTYKLTTPKLTGIYKIKQPLYIPINATLTRSTTSETAIYVDAGWNGDYAIYMEDSSGLQYLTVDGQRRVPLLIRACHKDDIYIGNCMLRYTNNDYPDGSDSARGHIIHAEDCASPVIRNNTLRCAMYDPSNGGKANGYDWEGGADLIRLSDSTDIDVCSNDIGYALGHGINIERVVGANIQWNIIQYCGLNRLYDSSFGTGDGIGGYHNLMGNIDLDWYINDNDIMHCENHGIHVSGKDITVRACYFNDNWNTNLCVYDWRTTGGQDCSKYVTITYNTFNDCPDSGNDSVWLNVYQPATFTISNNGGNCYTTTYGSTCNW